MSLVVPSEVNFDLLMLVSYTTLYLKAKASVSELNLDTQVTKVTLKKTCFHKLVNHSLDWRQNFALKKVKSQVGQNVTLLLIS